MPRYTGYSGGYRSRRKIRLYRPYVQRSFRYRSGRGRMSAVMQARRKKGYTRPSFAYRNARTGGLLGIETKFLDIPMTTRSFVTSVDATGGELQPSSVVTGCLSAPAQGDGAQNRDGKKIIIKSALIQGNITFEAEEGITAAPLACTIYLALVQDTQTNGVTINSEDVFTNPVGSALSAANPFRNMSNTQRFKVLKTFQYTVDTPSMANDTGATGGITFFGKTIPFDISWKGMIPVNFTAASTSADVANVVDNSLHLIGFANNTGWASSVQCNTRIRFIG